MALTAERYQALYDSGLVQHFEENRQEFTEMAQEAYTYAANYVRSAGLPVRVDDVAQVLVPALRLSDTLTTHLQSRKMRQQYWAAWFGDLVLDQLWEGLNDGQAGADTERDE